MELRDAATKAIIVVAVLLMVLYVKYPDVTMIVAGSIIVLLTRPQVRQRVEWSQLSTVESRFLYAFGGFYLLRGLYGINLEPFIGVWGDQLLLWGAGFLIIISLFYGIPAIKHELQDAAFFDRK